MFSLLPLLTLVVPTFIAVLCLFTNPFWFLKPFFKRIEKESLMLGTGATLAIMLLMVPDILADVSLETPILFLRVDYSNALGMVGVAIIFVLVSVFNIHSEKGGRLSPSMYNFFVLLFEICMLGLLMAYDLFLILVFVELTIGVSIVLVAHAPIKLASESAFKYLILTAVSALFVMFAVLLVYILTGTSDITNIGKEVNPLIESPRLILLVVASFIIGLGADIGLVPFHGWAPDVFPASTPAVNGFFCAEPIACILALYKLVYPFYAVYPSPIILGLMVGVGALSVLTGAVMGYSQTDALRMMAYTSIDAFGQILLALGLFTPLGFMAGQFYLVNAAFMKMGVLLSLGAVYHHTGTNDMGQLGGLVGRLRPVAFTYIFCALSVAGAPPLSGFFAKWLLYNTLNEFLLPYGLWASSAALIILVSFSMVSGVYLVRSFQRIFLGPLSDRWKDVKETPLAMWLPAAVVALLAVVLGIAPGILLNLMGYP